MTAPSTMARINTGSLAELVAKQPRIKRCLAALEHAAQAGHWEKFPDILGHIEAPGHVARVGVLAERLGALAGLSDEDAQMLRWAAPLHDFGKLAIPSSILGKPGRLTIAEFQLVKRHTTIGHALLARSEHPILMLGALISLTHHERVDGTGYPSGIAGDEIPLAGRIVAVVDVFDALLSARSYKPAFSLDKTMTLLQKGAGTHLDPRLVAILILHIDDFVEAYERHR